MEMKLLASAQPDCCGHLVSEAQMEDQGLCLSVPNSDFWMKILRDHMMESSMSPFKAKLMQ